MKFGMCDRVSGRPSYGSGFQPSLVAMVLTQGDALGWYVAAPLALKGDLIG